MHAALDRIPARPRTSDIDFVDPQCKCAVYRVLNLRTGPVPTVEADRLKTLNLSVCSITRLDGIEAFRGLEQLFLDDNQLSDLAPLAMLPALKELAVRGNPIASLAPLTELSTLNHLYIDDAHLSREALAWHIPALRQRGIAIDIQGQSAPATSHNSTTGEQ